MPSRFMRFHGIYAIGYAITVSLLRPYFEALLRRRFHIFVAALFMPLLHKYINITDEAERIRYIVIFHAHYMPPRREEARAEPLLIRVLAIYLHITGHIYTLVYGYYEMKSICCLLQERKSI